MGGTPTEDRQDGSAKGRPPCIHRATETRRDRMTTHTHYIYEVVMTKEQRKDDVPQRFHR